ncbi:T9SS type A sorting domain-containing protein [uncultured Fluviicola sp.]|uniref:T9SS type A sorting domain-containing protein n=1 Tax=uncultured Fluviicola sp. TaxID=463303 RepID=UPI0025F5DCB3|nr:T9SS type A sorting domain-containing protein [uncultured Fluviicola sp.]
MKKLIISCLLFLTGTAGIHAQLTNSGNIRTFTGANVTIYGDVTNNGTIADSGTLVTLAGSSLQTFGGSSVTTLKNLLLNNTSASGVTLAQALNVRGTLTFTDGYLNTTAVNLLTMTSTSAASGASNNSFVSGPVAKLGNTAFVFPTGKNVVYAPIAIGAPGVVTDQFTAEYFQVSPTPTYPTSSFEPALNHISECEYWMLDRTTGSSDVAVTLSWDTRSCGVTNLSDLRVARWDGAQWTDKGNGGTTGTTAAGTVVSSAAVTGFGPFTLASSTLTNPLPVELVTFAANCEQEKAVLRWSTESEYNNDYFSIESSLNAQDWQTAATIEGSGTTSDLSNYLWVDASNRGRDMYYRLSQTDYNGTTTVHEPVYLSSCSETDSRLSIYPNPAKSVVNILTDEKITQIRILDPAGKVVAVPIDYHYQQINFGELPNGVYFIEVTTPKAIFNEKVVISRD